MPNDDGVSKGDVHVYPVDDLHQHEVSPDCECGPTWDGWIWMHHAWDQREQRERREAMQ